jgi:hypothetical protein
MAKSVNLRVTHYSEPSLINDDSYLPEPLPGQLLTYDAEGKLEEALVFFHDEAGDQLVIEIDKFPSPWSLPPTGVSADVYYVEITEYSGSQCWGHGFGTIEITASGDFIVNGVQDGPLQDKYDDGLTIYPETYIRFFDRHVRQTSCLAAILAMKHYHIANELIAEHIYPLIVG